VGLQIERT